LGAVAPLGVCKVPPTGEETIIDAPGGKAISAPNRRTRGSLRDSSWAVVTPSRFSASGESSMVFSSSSCATAETLAAGAGAELMGFTPHPAKSAALAAQATLQTPRERRCAMQFITWRG